EEPLEGIHDPSQVPYADNDPRPREQPGDRVHSAAPAPVRVEYDLLAEYTLVVALKKRMKNIATLLLSDHRSVVVLRAHGGEEFLKQRPNGARHACMNCWILPQNRGEKG